MRVIFWVILALCLLFACVTDCRTCQVYNFTWWISGTAAGLLWLMGRQWTDREGITGLLIFILLQLLLFSKMYGRADCYGFCVCAVAEAAVGMRLVGFLTHMALAFGILALVQGARHNINNRGNLRRPVPFLPYITLAFWALLWYHGNQYGF